MYFPEDGAHHPENHLEAIDLTDQQPQPMYIVYAFGYAFKAVNTEKVLLVKLLCLIIIGLFEVITGV